MNELIPGLVLDDEVEDGASAVEPGVEVERDGAGGDLEEAVRLRNRGLHPLRLRSQLRRLRAHADAGIKSRVYVRLLFS